MLQQIYPTPVHPFEFELHKDMNFAAAHFVPHEGAGACKFMHGHTYFVDIAIAGNKLDEQGFLTNFATIKKLIHGRYDHKVMNDQIEFSDGFGGNPESFPTTENVAKNISEIVQNHLNEEGNMAVCVQVFVRETPTSYIVYRQPFHYETQTLVADGRAYKIETDVFKTGRRVHD